MTIETIKNIFAIITPKCSKQKSLIDAWLKIERGHTARL